MRLEDIDIIGAIGDSDTAAFAANSRGGLDYFTEYRGVSFATGTDGSWANNPSLANLLRACNPGLKGEMGFELDIPNNLTLSFQSSFMSN